MEIFPAIDLRDGQVVRLTQGDFGRMEVYRRDPLETAEWFKKAGAKNLHVVDLDGAKAGAPRNADILASLARQGGLFIQTGGGIRTAERVEKTLALGAGRVILGTVAVKEPGFVREMVAQYGDKIAVGVDARGGRVAVGGWLETTDTDAFAFCRTLRDAGVKTVVFTDIEKDGELAGPNLAAYEALAEIEGLNVIASGGVTSEADLRALRKIGVQGAIIGKALYEGKLDLARAIGLAAGEEPA